MKPCCQSNSSRHDDRKMSHSGHQRLPFTPMLASVFLLALFLAACSTHNSAANKTTPPATSANLVSTAWQLEDLAGTPALPTARPTLSFPEQGKTADNASCNRFAGSVEIGNGTIKFGALASTRMACIDDKVSMQEAHYLKALGAATRFESKGNELLIYCYGFDEPLRFTRTPAAKS
ncbi:MAG: META domain-containing protein [Candidatus Acidiferrum sp.]